MRIAVYFENSEFSRMALKMASIFTKNANADLFVISTITRDDPIKYSKLQRLEEEFELKIAKIKDCQNISYESKLLVDFEEAGEQIVKFVKRKKIDWLYIGTPRKSKLAKLIVGSTALFVIINAPCLVVSINDQVDLDQ